MSYIKYGIVTKIENIDSDKLLVTKNIFNLKLYKEKNNYYVLREKVLNDNLKKYRKELMVISNFKSDSIENCEAYCLNTTADELLENKIHFINNDDSYYFDSYENFVFDFEKVYYFTEHICLKLNFLSVFWDITKVSFEEFDSLNVFLNNIAKKALTNCLKDASLLCLI